ncbi:hypothetical protein CTEN210_02860 [Chaetoceros tenuissimus]|uniref:Leucine-rich repeat domain-containing protein n=1 Tax=Chaetoceros tenuissimus TaxID=426638 RepID=A0AAD3CK66_9STRA|nr:hypothetical protein CTEN210_02860 [Chaetoceros tenuissimus]
MRVATVDGLVTLFYDGSKELYNEELEQEWSLGAYNFSRAVDPLGEGWEDWDMSDECKAYCRRRRSWQQIIIEEGVTEIPAWTFVRCTNIKRVIFSNTVIRIEECAFYYCKDLIFIKLSINLAHIGSDAFQGCDLISVFIPSSCRAIKWGAFSLNKNLKIFHVPNQIELEPNVLGQTKVFEESPFELNEYGEYHDQTDEVHDWLKNINNDEKYSLHRACCSFQPLKEVIINIILQRGIGAFNIKNEAGITPSRYLKENPYADIKETEIIRDYIMKIMGEHE